MGDTEQLQTEIARLSAALVECKQNRQAADNAIAYLLRRLRNDPELAYYFGHTTALELLTRANALATGVDPDQFHAHFQSNLITERPRCPVGECREGR